LVGCRRFAPPDANGAALSLTRVRVQYMYARQVDAQRRGDSAVMRESRAMGSALFEWVARRASGPCGPGCPPPSASEEIPAVACSGLGCTEAPAPVGTRARTDLPAQRRQDRRPARSASSARTEPRPPPVHAHAEQRGAGTRHRRTVRSCRRTATSLTASRPLASSGAREGFAHQHA
jgi:hypothetical protein